MKKILIIITTFISLNVISQPLYYTEELVLKLHNIKLDCKKFKKCFEDYKLSGSLVSGKIADYLHTSVIFKLSGDKGKIGGQAWIKAGNNVWIGGELTSDLKFKKQTEFLISYQFKSFFPYVAISPEEKASILGFKYYHKKLLSLSFEIENVNYIEVEKDVLSLKDFSYSFALGVPLSLEGSKNLLNIFNKK